MKSLFVVKSNPVPGRESEFNRWYTDIHLPEVIQIEGFQSAQRFQLNKNQVQPGQSHTYLAIYEIDSENVAATLDNLNKATRLTKSYALDQVSMDISVFDSIADVIYEAPQKESTSSK